MKILVTGGAGFIGSAIAQRLLATGHTVVVFDNLETGQRANVPDDVELVEGDIRDLDAVKRVVRGVDDVIHQAAMVSVPASVEDPGYCFDVNITGTRNVLDAARRAGCRRVTLASSAAVYGAAPHLPAKESAQLAPASPYAYSKFVNEVDALYYHQYFGLQTLCLRYFNVYGPGQSPRSPYAGVIAIVARQLLAREPVTVFGTGEQTRDYVYFADVAGAVVRAVEMPSLAEHVLNVGRGQQVSLLEMIAELGRLLGHKPEVRFAEQRKGDVLHSLADIERLERSLGLPSATPLAVGLEQTLKWMQAGAGCAGG
jgi:UDP-glucose 4-epimerase